MAYFDGLKITMGIKQLSRQLVITGALLIWTIKFIIRPYHLLNDTFSFFLGIAPNLLGSFLVPFAACWFFEGRSHRWARVFQVYSISRLRWLCSTSFGLLIVNECLQLIPFFGRTFDPYDILFSLFGLTAAYFCFGKLLQQYQPAAD